MPPSIRLTDQNRTPVEGVGVVFAVTAGGGTVSGATQITDGNGVATVGEWVLGRLVGSDTSAVNTLTATVAASNVARNPVTFTATGWGNFWTRKWPLITARSNLGAAAGIAFAGEGTGGALVASTELYSVANNRWTAGLAMPTPRMDYGVAGTYVVGGADADGHAVATMERYFYMPELCFPTGCAPEVEEWTTLPPMPTARRGVGVTSSEFWVGVIYAVGGRDAQGNTVGTVEAYGGGAWSPRASMPTPRAWLSVAYLNGVLYAVGGADASNNALATVEAYDPVTNTWSSRAPLAFARYKFGLAAVNGLLYAVGGEQWPNTQLSSVEAYDPGTDSWSPRSPLPFARSAFGLGASWTAGAWGPSEEWVVYVVGGRSETTAYLRDVHMYLP